jgi:two-component system CheB/CheR fusion protein
VLDTLVSKEAEIQVKNGGWFLMRIRPYRTIENLIEGAVVTFVDISERKKAEESLRRSESRLNAFINQASAGVGETDMSGNFRFVNDRLCKMLGYKRDELLQSSVRDILDPEDLAAAQAQLQDVAQGGQESHGDRHYVRKNGSRLRAHERVSVIRDAAGRSMSLLYLSFEADDRE